MQFLSALDTKATYRSSLSLRMYSSYASLIIFNCLRIEKFENIYKFKINFDTTLKHFVDLITIKTNSMASEHFFYRCNKFNHAIEIFFTVKNNFIFPFLLNMFR